MFTHVAVLALLQMVVTPASPGSAATAAVVVNPGTRVRFRLGGQKHDPVLVGTVMAEDPDSITLRLDPASTDLSTLGDQSLDPDGLATVPRAAIGSLEVSGGQNSNALKGLLIGGAAGALTGAGVGAFASCNGVVTQMANPFDPSACTGPTIGDLTLYAGLVGAGIGLVSGLLSHHERWLKAGPVPPLAPVLERGAAGTRVGLAIRLAAIR